jgi:hypothetical protein
LIEEIRKASGQQHVLHGANLAITLPPTSSKVMDQLQPGDMAGNEQPLHRKLSKGSNGRQDMSSLKL